MNHPIIDRNYCQMMATYNEWMNRKLFNICAEISDRERKQDRGAFFKSIHGTLNHLLLDALIWLSRFIAPPFAGAGPGQELYADFGELQQAREVCDRQIIEWSATLSSEWLAQVFHYTNLSGQANAHPAWILVTHLFNHQTHHRGQLVTLISQLGDDPGITDLPWMPDIANSRIHKVDASTGN
jgi:uncharacterized damage-inducible protein DinB